MKLPTTATDIDNQVHHASRQQLCRRTRSLPNSPPLVASWDLASLGRTVLLGIAQAQSPSSDGWPSSGIGGGLPTGNQCERLCHSHQLPGPCHNSCVEGSSTTPAEGLFVKAWAVPQGYFHIHQQSSRVRVCRKVRCSM
ncbi:hypothetical protein V2G26_008674 [Clonostachys chloroleuca]